MTPEYGCAEGAECGYLATCPDCDRCDLCCICGDEDAPPWDCDEDPHPDHDPDETPSASWRCEGQHDDCGACREWRNVDARAWLDEP